MTRAFAILVAMIATPLGDTLGQKPCRSLGAYQTAIRGCKNPLFTRFGNVACLLPEFSGAYLDSTGTLFVLVTDLRVGEEAKHLVAYELQLQHHSPAPMKVTLSKFSYWDLEGFLEKLEPYLNRDICDIGVNESRNQLRVGFCKEAARDRVTAILRKLRIPLAAVDLVRTNIAIPTD